MNKARFYRFFPRVFCACAVVLSSGCGGGSMGTGIAPRTPLTLNDKRIEKPSAPRLPSWLRGKPGACLMQREGNELPVEVESEIGAAVPATMRALRCAFTVANQAQQITVRSTWFADGENVSYRLERVNCDSGSRSPLQSGASTVNLSSIQIATALVPQNHFVLAALERPNGDSISIVLMSDQLTECLLLKENP